MAKPLRWARRRSAAMSSPNTYELRRDGVVYAIVQQCKEGWFSYGLTALCNWNTSSNPTDLEAAKVDAAARVWAALSDKAKP